MYKNIIFLFILLLCLSACSEKIGRRYISKKFDRELYINSSPKATQRTDIRSISKDSAGNTIITTYYQDSVLKSIETVDNEKDKNHIGFDKYYYPNGKLKSIIYYCNKSTYSQIKTYYPNGALKRNVDYTKGPLFPGKCYDSLGNRVPYFDYETEPKVDLERLSACLVYPDNLRSVDCQEIIIIKILITDKKKVQKIPYDSENSKEFIQEVIRCIKKLNHDPDNFIIEPARVDGEAITCWISIPIKFRLR